MTPSATQLFRLRLAKYLLANPDVKPAPLGKAAGKSDSYIRRMMSNPDQSPTLDTAEKIANEIELTLVEMIMPDTPRETLAGAMDIFRQLDPAGQKRAIAAMQTDLEIQVSERSSES